MKEYPLTPERKLHMAVEELSKELSKSFAPIFVSLNKALGKFLLYLESKKEKLMKNG